MSRHDRRRGPGLGAERERVELVGLHRGGIPAPGRAAFLLILACCIPLPAPGRDTGAVRPDGSMHIPRAAHAATLLRDGRVLITGGFGREDGSYTNTAELFDPETKGFVRTGAMGDRRCCHTSTLLPDGRVLIAGGFDGRYLGGAEIFNPSTGTFTPAGSLSQPRMDHVAVQLGDGRVLLIGGVSTGWTFLATAEIFDPATGAFTPTGSMSVPRESLTATLLRDGRVLVTGGHRGRHAQLVIYDSAEIYDPRRGVFTPTGRMHLRRHKHDAVLMADGRVLVSGGSDETDDRNAYASAEIFGPRRGAFRLAPRMPSVRYKHPGTSLLLADGRILLAAGAREAAVYDPGLDRFLSVSGSMGRAPLSRLFATATLLRDGRALITGGYGVGQEVSAGTWIYAPSPTR